MRCPNCGRGNAGIIVNYGMTEAYQKLYANLACPNCGHTKEL